MEPPVGRLHEDAPPAGAALGLFVAVALAFPFLGGLAQLANISFGLLWTELFLFLLPAWFLVRLFRSDAGAWLRLLRPPPAAVALGFLCGLANYPLTGALEAVVRGYVVAHWPKVAHMFDIAASTLGSVAGWQRAVLLLAVGFAAPLCEETMFRGLILRSLSRRLRPALAIGITAVLFGLVHYEPIGFLARTELGVLFGLLVLWTDSLWSSIAAHAANNLFATALYFFASGTSDAASPPPSQLLGLAAIGVALTAPLLIAIRRMHRPQPEPAAAAPRPFLAPALLWLGLGALSWLGLLGLGVHAGTFAHQIAR